MQKYSALSILPLAAYLHVTPPPPPSPPLPPLHPSSAAQITKSTGFDSGHSFIHVVRVKASFVFKQRVRSTPLASGHLLQVNSYLAN